MSSESYINDYLKNKRKPNIEYVSEAQLLGMNIDLNPLRAVVKSIGKVSNVKDLLKLSDKTKTIKKISSDTIQKVDKIYKSKESKPLPTPNKPIRDEKSADTYLRSFYSYIENKVDGLSWSDFARSYFNTKTVVRNVLVSFGILTAGALAGGGIGRTSSGGGKKGTVIGVALGSTMTALISLIIVVISVANAVEKSADFSDDGEPIIDYNKAWRNVIRGFKNVFSGKDFPREATILVRVTALIVPLTTFFAFTFNLLWKDLFKKGGRMIGSGLYTVGHIVHAFGNAIWNKFRESDIIQAVFPSDKSSDNVVKRIGGEGKFKKIFGRDWNTIISNKKAARIFMQGQVSKFGKILSYIILPLLSLAVVLYLFSELLDAMHLKKIKEETEEESNQSGIEDII